MQSRSKSEKLLGKSMIAGKTHSTIEEDFDPNVSLVKPIPDTPKTASLGMLALGAQGVQLWRRRKKLQLN